MKITAEDTDSDPYPGYQPSYSLAPTPLPHSYAGIPSPGSLSFIYPQNYNQFPALFPHNPPLTLQSPYYTGVPANPSIGPSLEAAIINAAAQYNHHAPDSKADESNSGRILQHFIDPSKAKLQDEERGLESVLSNSNWFQKGSHKTPHRTFTMDKERGCRTPLMQILQTRFISPLEEDGHETVTLTINDERTEKEQSTANCNMKWM
jgi:hypothetical protein